MSNEDRLKKTFKFTFISLVCLRVKLMQLKPYKFTSVLRFGLFSNRTNAVKIIPLYLSFKVWNIVKLLFFAIL